MSRQVILNFGARALKEARQVARDIAKQVQQVAKQIKDPQLRKQFKFDQAQQARERAEETKAARARMGLNKRADALDGREWGGAHNAGLRRARESAGGARTLLNNLAAGNIGGILVSLGTGASGLLPALGPIAAIAGTVLTVIMPELERREAARNAGIDAQITAKVDRAIADADIPGRLKRDPIFRRRFENDAANRFVATQRAMAGWHPRSARVLDGF